MRLTGILLFMLVCLIWAGNIIVSRVLFADYAIPPVYYAAVRFLIIAVILAPLLRPLPRPLAPTLIIGLLMGAIHFGLMFIGLSMASANSLAVVLQISIPITAILSMVFLGERLSVLQMLGVVLACGGVFMVLWQPGMALSTGLLFGLASAVAMAVGSLMIKRFATSTPLQLQAWIGIVSAPPLILFTALAETNQLQASIQAGWVFAAALAFSVLLVTMFAHTAYFSLLRRYPASIIAPLSLMMPVMSVTMGVVLLNEPFGTRMAIGSVLTLVGLIPILVRFPNRGARAISGEA